MEFSTHPVKWTREKVARFWDQVPSRPGSHQRYFSYMVGASLVAWARRRGVPLDGAVLDFGCGLGDLLDLLLAEGGECEGLEFSETSARVARERLSSRAGFRGVCHADSLPTPMDSGRFDSVFLVETIEHLLDGDLTPTLGEIFRILRPGGFVIVTTPNCEDMKAVEVLCPDCGAVFHPIQHQRSWDKESLSRTMEEHGFSTVRCEAVYFTQKTIPSRAKAALYRLLRYKLPHLVYVGRRRDLDPPPERATDPQREVGPGG